MRLRGIEPLRLTAYPPARQAALWREYPGGSDGEYSLEEQRLIEDLIRFDWPEDQGKDLAPLSPERSWRPSCSGSCGKISCARR